MDGLPVSRAQRRPAVLSLTLIIESRYSTRPTYNPFLPMYSHSVPHSRSFSTSAILCSLPAQGLRLPFPDGKHFIPAEQIVALRSIRNYTLIHFLDRPTLLYSRTLSHVLRRLPTSYFARIHRSHAINRQHIHTLSDLHVLLTDGSKWVVSRRRSL